MAFRSAILIMLAAGCAAHQPTVAIGAGVTVALPTGWEVVPAARAGEAASLVRKRGTTVLARGQVVIEERTSHAEALTRLRDVATELDYPAQALTIDGWPAVIRRYMAPTPQLGIENAGKMEGRHEQTLRVTVAVAAGDKLVRIDTMLTPGTEPKIADEAEAVARRMVLGGKPLSADTEREVGELRKIQRVVPLPGAPRSLGPAMPIPKEGGQRPGQGGVATSVNAGFGELEAAMSNDGTVVVVAGNFGDSFSTDSAKTFNASTDNGFTATFGDRSLAVGQSGNFYMAFIPNFTSTQCLNGLASSTDNGKTFNFVSNPVQCPATGTAPCFPDQEHLAADRNNSANNQDQLYVVWRNFPISTAPGSNCLSLIGPASPQIICSQDSGSTWPTQRTIGAGDFPRVAVGSDGFVYVVYVSGGNVTLNKLSSCSAGLTQQKGFPRTVASFNAVSCPVAGLDRCNNGNVLSSPTVAVDDLDAKKVYVAFATNTKAPPSVTPPGCRTSAGNEDVVLVTSKDGGNNWSGTTRINTTAQGRRFLPWVCVTNGIAHLTWYDRRSATSTTDDATAFFRGKAAVDTPGGALIGSEFNVSQASDAECASGWPSSERSQNDSLCCSTQPQVAGVCQTTTGAGSQQACDFTTATPCPIPGETCTAPQNAGRPKYGDYNGNACAGGRTLSVWASAAAPPGISGAPSGINIYAEEEEAPPLTDVGLGVTGAVSNIYFFATNTDGHIFYDRAPFKQAGVGWTEVEGGGLTDAAPAAGAIKSHIFVAIKGLDGAVYINQADVAKPFGQWFPANFQTDAAPAVTGVGDNVYFFAKQSDGRIFYNRAKLGSAGVGWAEVDGGGRTDAAPAAGAVGTHVFVAIKGTDGAVYLNQADLAKPFGQWFPMSFQTDVAVAATGVGDNIYFFAKQSDGRIFYNRAKLGSAGVGWVEVDGNGRTDGPPAAGAIGTHVYVAVKGLDGSIYVNQADLGKPFGQWFAD